MKHYDIIIVGGGLSGSTQACALAHHGLKVLVLDHVSPDVILKAKYDGRTTAISYGSSNLYRGIDIWDEFEPASEPILDIRVSDKDSPWFLHYDHRDVGSRPMGYILENLKIRQTLYNRALSYSNLDWIAPAKVCNMSRDESGVNVKLESGDTFKASLILACDGRNSQMRDMVEIPVTSWTYKQKAIVCLIKHENSHDGIAHEHFLPTGPFAVLPMQGNRSSVVWSLQEDRVQAMLDNSPEEFADALQARFGESLGKITLDSDRWCYPLGVQFATTYIDKRFALIGDAAHVIHPIAGQGLNMGLRDVAAMTQVVVEAHRLGLDIGGYTTLEKYQRWRRFDNMTMIMMTDKLTRLFSNNVRPLRFVRDMGLGIVNKIKPLKKHAMEHAMGLSGELPRLIAGEKL